MVLGDDNGSKWQKGFIHERPYNVRKLINLGVFDIKSSKKKAVKWRMKKPPYLKSSMNGTVKTTTVRNRPIILTKDYQ